MKGIFTKNTRKKFFGVFLIFAASYICIRFSIWEVNAIINENFTDFLFCLSAVILGALLGLLGIYILIFNRKAFLTIKEQAIIGKFGFNKKINLNISKIIYVDALISTLKLYTPNGVISIDELDNANELCDFIASRIVMPDFSKNKDKAWEKYNYLTKIRKRRWIITAFLALLMFVNIGLFI